MIEALTYEEAKEKSLQEIQEVDWEGVFNNQLDYTQAIDFLNIYLEKFRKLHINAILSAYDAASAVSFISSTLEALNENTKLCEDSLEILLS